MYETSPVPSGLDKLDHARRARPAFGRLDDESRADRVAQIQTRAERHLAVDALIQWRTPRRDERAVDAEDPVEVGRAEYLYPTPS